MQHTINYSRLVVSVILIKGNHTKIIFDKILNYVGENPVLFGTKAFVNTWQLLEYLFFLNAHIKLMREHR